jgi:hypothetical protein
VIHLFISYDSLCHGTVSWSKGINFGVESWYQIHHHPHGKCLSVFLSHTSGEVLVTRITRVIILLCGTWDVGLAVLHTLNFGLICFTTAKMIKNEAKLQREPGVFRTSRLGGCNGWEVHRLVSFWWGNVWKAET